jgi:hypothetical protein
VRCGDGLVIKATYRLRSALINQLCSVVKHDGSMARLREPALLCTSALGVGQSCHSKLFIYV